MKKDNKFVLWANVNCVCFISTLLLLLFGAHKYMRQGLCAWMRQSDTRAVYFQTEEKLHEQNTEEMSFFEHAIRIHVRKNEFRA